MPTRMFSGAAVLGLVLLFTGVNAMAEDVPFPQLPKGAGKIDSDAPKSFTTTKSGARSMIAATSGFFVPPTARNVGCSQKRVHATGTTPSSRSVSVADGTSETTRGTAVLTSARAAAPSSPRTPPPR